MTEQQSDRIIIDGSTWRVLADMPLGPAGRRLPSDVVAPHTALWRAYMATWSVIDGRLVLERIDFHTPTGWGAIDVPPDERLARWVTADVRIVTGDPVRHVHAGHGSRYEIEQLLHITDGGVRSIEPLAPAAPHGSAGPYALQEEIVFGAFGRVYAGTTVEGATVAVKVAAGRSMDPWSGTMITRADGRLRPLGVGPTVAVRDDDAEAVITPVGDDLAALVLHAQHDMLEADQGAILPMSHGTWQHEPSGLPALVMEHIDGRPIGTEHDVLLVLEALALAAGRGVMPAHGDLKENHVRITPDGRVRLLDPAPPLPDGLRTVTPLYNPHGWTGPAADVAACGWIMRYCLPQPQHAWTWVRRVCDFAQPPRWALRHADARDELRRCLDDDPIPLPPGWAIPELPVTSAFGDPPQFAWTWTPGDSSEELARHRKTIETLNQRNAYLRGLLLDVGRLAAEPGPIAPPATAAHTRPFDRAELLDHFGLDVDDPRHAYAIVAVQQELRQQEAWDLTERVRRARARRRDAGG